MLRFHRILAASLLIASAPAADRWIEYRTGPFHVFSNAGDRAARERLNEMEQLRWVLGNVLGKEGAGKNGIESVWPIDVVLFSNAREYGPHALPKPFVNGGSAILSAWTADTPLPRNWLRALTRLFLDENATRMPEAIETGLCDLFSTIKVNTTHVMLGEPLSTGELPPDRLRGWAKMQLLATGPDYSGKLRVYLNNLQQTGDESVGARNAFDLTMAQLDAQVDQYLKAGTFQASRVSGKALDLNRDFPEKPVEKETLNALLAELSSGGKSFPPDSPRGLLAKGTRPTLELAASANPRWAEPHFRLAALETSLSRIKELKTATTLDSRNAVYWQALAEAQAGANEYADAAKSWSAAEHAAVNEAERVRIHQARMDLDQHRADFEASEKKRIAEEQARELQRIKDAAAAEVHAAEDAANRRLNAGAKPVGPVMAWWDDPQGAKISGTLTRVDCLNGPIRLTIQKDGGGLSRLVIRNPRQLVIYGSTNERGEASFGCGVQRPARKIRLVFDAKPDAKLGSAGDVLVVEFP